MTEHYKGVERLTDADFANVSMGTPISQIKLPFTRPTYIIVMASWCGHCKRFGPVVEQVNNSLGQNASVDIRVIDSDQSPQVVKKLGVQGFPTMFIYYDGLVKLAANRDQKNLTMCLNLLANNTARPAECGNYE